MLALPAAAATWRWPTARDAQAEAAFSQARSLTTMAPMPFEIALLNLDDGRRLAAFGHRPAAVASLEEAHQVFSDLGADPFVQACAAELPALEVSVAASGTAAAARAQPGRAGRCSTGRHGSHQQRGGDRAVSSR